MRQARLAFALTLVATLAVAPASAQDRTETPGPPVHDQQTLEAFATARALADQDVQFGSSEMDVIDELSPSSQGTLTSTSRLPYGLPNDRPFAAAPGVHPRCGGETARPHESTLTRWRDHASVHGRTTCAGGSSIAWLWVETTLYREDWWGLNPMGTSYSERTNSRTSKDAAPHAYCGGTPNRWYRGVSAHQFIDGNKAYVAATGNRNQFAC